MCKEDIRLARSAHPQSTFTGAPPGAATKMLIGNPNRYSVLVSVQDKPVAIGDICVQVYALSGNNVYPLAVLTDDHPSMIVNIEQVGNVLCDPIYAVSRGNIVAPILNAAETGWDQELESI